MQYVLLLGRFFFSLIFITKAFHHFSASAVMHATDMGAPLAHLLVPLAGVLSLLGGLSILLGYKARIGAWLLVIFLVPVTLVMHRFWEMNDGVLGMLHHLCFMKNLSLLGSVLMVAYFGSGPLSLSQQKARSKR